MCVLQIYSDVKSFKVFAGETNVPVYSTYEKGDYRNKTKNLKRSDYRISFDVSDKEWNDVKGQINDAILFLKKYSNEIESLISNHDISSAYLDFPIYSQLDDNIVNQNEHLPKELITLAGKLSLGIEMSFYSKEAFE